MMQFLCGVAFTLLAESVALIFATEWLRKKTEEDHAAGSP